MNLMIANNIILNFPKFYFNYKIKLLDKIIKINDNNIYYQMHIYYIRTLLDCIQIIIFKSLFYVTVNSNLLPIFLIVRAYSRDIVLLSAFQI